MTMKNAPDAGTAAQYKAAGFIGGFSLGSRPALVVVDFSLGFTNENSPLGSDMSEAVGQTAKLLAGARERDVFTVFTTIAFDTGTLDSLAWVRNSTFVIPECVADRALAPHEASLFDMTAKYADALSAREAVDYVQQLPSHTAQPPRRGREPP